jgi:hypothetical protein
MKTLKLPREAEEIRKEIKQMIPETALPPKQFNPTQAELLNEDENGNRRYGGDLLALKIAVLTGGMKIGTVSISVGFPGFRLMDSRVGNGVCYTGRKLQSLSMSESKDT